MRPYFFSLLLAAAFLGGCRNPCRQLAEKLCDCKPTTSEKELCLREVQRLEASLDAPITEEQQSICREKLDPTDGGEPCDCRKLEDADSAVRTQAKFDCGLAR